MICVSASNKWSCVPLYDISFWKVQVKTVRFSFSQPCREPILPDCIHQAHTKEDHEMLLFSSWVLWEWHTLLSPQHCWKINPELKMKEMKQTVICGGMQTGTLGTNLFGPMLQSLWFAVIALLISGHGDFLNFFVTRLVASLITPNYDISRQLGNQNVLVGKLVVWGSPFFAPSWVHLSIHTQIRWRSLSKHTCRLPQIAGAGT